METNSNSSSPTFIKRFIQWLFSWRTARRILVSLAILATLIVIFYMEENWRGKRAWENCKRELEAKGAVLDWEKFIPPPVPDDQNFFKAPKMQQWFVKPGGLHTLTEPDTNGWAGLSTNGLTTTVITNEAVAVNYLKWSDQFQPNFDLIREALKRPYARMDRDYSQPFQGPIQNFIATRTLAQVLAQRTKCFLLLGQPEKALREVTLLNDSRHFLEGKPMLLVSAMINVAVTGLYADTIANGLQSHAWQEPQLAAIQEQLKKINLTPIVADAFKMERVASSQVLTTKSPSEIANLFYAGDKKITFLEKIQNPMYRFLVFAPRGWVYQNMVTVSKILQQEIDSVDAAGELVSPRGLNEAMHELETTFKSNSPYNFFASKMIPNFIKAWQTTARNQILADETQIVCALERYRLAHGEYPETFDALAPQFIEKIPHDIIGGQPLHYRRVDGGKFLLYSVGWNETDDGGQIAFTKGGSVDREKGDWVWQYPQK